METVAKFEKVSFEQFKKDTIERFSQHNLIEKMDIESLYNKITLPIRSTSGSAGYDFFYPFDATSLIWDDTLVIPTGVKCEIKEGWALYIFPRSSLGIKYRCTLDNTVGIIDSDYYNNEANEGHIFINITNRHPKLTKMLFDHNMRFCQGVFLPFGIAEGDNATQRRVGGYGSTGK